MKYLITTLLLIITLSGFGQREHQPYLQSQLEKDFPDLYGIETIFVYEESIDTTKDYRFDIDNGPLVQKIQLNDNSTIKAIRYYTEEQEFPTAIFKYNYEYSGDLVVEKLMKNYKTSHQWTYRNGFLISEQINKKNGKMETRWDYSYHENDKPRLFVHTDSKQDTISKHFFTFDKEGRRLFNYEITKADTVKKNLYFYDTTGIEEIKKAHPNIFSGKVLVHLIETDSAGNEISLKSYKNQYRVVFRATYTYDLAGNVTNITIPYDDEYFPKSNTFEYDNENNLISAIHSRNEFSETTIWNTYFDNGKTYVVPTQIADADLLVPPLFYKKTLDEKGNLYQLYCQNTEMYFTQSMVRKTYFLRKKVRTGF